MSNKNIFTAELRPEKGFAWHGQRFARANAVLVKELRESVQNIGRTWVEIAREIAPQGQTGEFRKSIHFRTFVKDEQIALRFYDARPLGTWIREGTKPHKIKPTRANALRFYWHLFEINTIVPKKGGFATRTINNTLWIGKGYVEHPGTEPNPYHETATEWLEDLYPQELNKVALRWGREITK